jgi:hypothetical protein
MLLKNKFIFTVVSIIILNILIYTLYINIDVDINMCICYANHDSVDESNISFGDLLNLANDQQFVEVPSYGYDITNSLIFFSKIKKKKETV